MLDDDDDDDEGSVGPTWAPGIADLSEIILRAHPILSSQQVILTPSPILLYTTNDY